MIPDMASIPSVEEVWNAPDIQSAALCCSTITETYRGL